MVPPRGSLEKGRLQLQATFRAATVAEEGRQAFTSLSLILHRIFTPSH